MDSKSEVERMVKEYDNLKRDMAYWSDMIVRYIPITDMDVIESMTFYKPDDAPVQSTDVSEKTAKIAAIYREVAAKTNDEELKSMILNYHRCKSQIDFIDFCLPRLRPAYSAMMVDLIQNEIAWASICAKYHISNTTVARYRRAAIDELVKWYDRRYQSFLVG